MPLIVPSISSSRPRAYAAPGNYIIAANKPGNSLKLLGTLIVLQSLLSACSLQQRLPPTTPISHQQHAQWLDHYKRMLALTDWHVKGKIGYRGADDAGSAWLDWRQRSEHFHLLLSGPFGAGTVDISGNSQYVTLRQAEQPDYTAASPEELSRTVLGWELPIEALTYWIRGIPSPATDARHQHFTEEALLSGFEQAGWQLQLNKYRATPAGPLPTKLSATRGETRVTLIIKEHSLENPVVENISGETTSDR
ncbi:MAG TPA: outer membrane lipoprotein LolB [Porticoccaceae bacterium]|nr:outer membrane lipoprotein LolB [Porticoccaceae bacterium]